MPHPRLKVALVIPAFNEESVISSVIASLHNVFKKTNYTYSVIVVNDGSKDRTEEQARKAKAIVIDHILNSGCGSATATGLSYAHQNDYDLAVTLDADGQHDARDVLKGVRILQKSQTDLLIGSRLMNNSGMSKTKVIGNAGLTLITFLLFNIRVTDSQSGLRVFSKRALRELKWKTSGYEFCSEMLWRAKQAGLLIDEYPIRAIYTEYSKGKGQNNWNGFNIVKNLISRRIMELLNE